MNRIEIQTIVCTYNLSNHYYTIMRHLIFLFNIGTIVLIQEDCSKNLRYIFRHQRFQAWLSCNCSDIIKKCHSFL